jgi:hypothetical protein
VLSSLELLKARLGAYPAAFRAIAPLSHGARNPVTSETARAVAEEINEWLYSAGGMSASATTRKAILGLRHECRRWSKNGGNRPPDLYEIRNLVLRCLRLDLDLVGLESADFNDSPTWLANLQAEVRQLERLQPASRR